MQNIQINLREKCIHCNLLFPENISQCESSEWEHWTHLGPKDNLKRDIDKSWNRTVESTRLAKLEITKEGAEKLSNGQGGTLLNLCYQSFLQQARKLWTMEVVSSASEQASLSMVSKVEADPPAPDPDAIKMFVGQVPRSMEEVNIVNMATIQTSYLSIYLHKHILQNLKMTPKKASHASHNQKMAVSSFWIHVWDYFCIFE